MDNYYQQPPSPQPQANLNPTSPIPDSPNPPAGGGWLKWVLIVLIVALTSSGTTYFVMNQSQQNQQPTQVTKTTPTPTPNPIANWKTYTNPKHGYSLKYPNEWSYTLGKGTEDQVVFENMAVVVTVNDNTEKPAIKSDARNKATQNTQVNIGGIIGEQATILDAPTGNVSYIQSAVIHSGKTYHFNLHKLDQRSTYDQMLSSFQFLGKTETSNWKAYQNETITFRFPLEWTQKPILVRGSGFTQEFEDPEDKFHLTFWATGNYSQVTGKPYANIDEYINMPYQVKILKVDGQEARQPLPRAGSENINSVVFFSKDSKFIYTLELKTGKSAIDAPEADIEEGQKFFDQILSTFRFE